MKLQTEPLVSVMTPVYNTDKYIAECIESVLAQTYQNWEYTIVNNRSTDRTLDIARSYAEKDARIRIHDNVEFLPIIANHNHAFSLIPPSAKYCKIVSADDWLYPDCIRQLVELAEAHPTVGFVNSYAISSVRINYVGVPYPETVVSGKEIGRRALLGGPYVLGAPSSLMYRADLIRSTKTFYPSASPHADTAACFDFLDRCDFGFVHQILSFERVHTGQTSEKSRIMNYYLAEHLRYLADYGSRYLDPGELRDRIKTVLSTYDRFLVKAVVRRRSEEFWTYHERQRREAGYPIRKPSLLKAMTGLVLDRALNPKQTVEGLFSRS